VKVREHLEELGVGGRQKGKVKVMFCLQQDMKAQRGSRGIALLFL
jgi:hypothetical protein